MASEQFECESQLRQPLLSRINNTQTSDIDINIHGPNATTATESQYQQKQMQMKSSSVEQQIMLQQCKIIHDQQQQLEQQQELIELLELDLHRSYSAASLFGVCSLVFLLITATLLFAKFWYAPIRDSRCH